jgi:penicillin-binding protein-related factor A (putative recombinase)
MTNLPPLPNQYKTKEGDFGVFLKRWVEHNADKMLACSLETKHSRGKDSLPFSEVKPEQLAFAARISSPKGAWIRTLGMNGEPDYVFLKNMPAYFAIKYPQGFVLITYGNFIFEKKKNKRKSLTWERAQDIAYKVIKML